MTTASKTTKAAARNLTAEIAFLTRALKAPTLRDCVDRLADRAREQGWSHEEFLVASSPGAAIKIAIDHTSCIDGMGLPQAALFREGCGPRAPGSGAV